MKEHRGRFQAQGKNLEESEHWASDKPITVEEGKKLIEKLKQKLSHSDLMVRTRAFADCEALLDALAENGGIDISLYGRPFAKSFVAKGQERVDIEIKSGVAFRS